MSFDWEKIKTVGISPADQFRPDITPYPPPRTATDIFFGKIPLNDKKSIAMLIDGMSFNTITQSMNFAMKAIDDPDLISKYEKNLNLKMENGDFQFIDLSNVFNDSEILILKQWIVKDPRNLVKIANEYEKNGRQFYHFLYDVAALVKSISKIPLKYHSQIMDTIETGDRLMHNRILAEIANSYLEKGHIVEIELPVKKDSPKPDLSIDGVIADVKTILTSTINDRASCADFAHKLKKDIEEPEKTRSQIGPNGIFFIAPWSGIINSIFYTYFHKMKMEGKHNFQRANFYEHLPALGKNQTIFVLSTSNAFTNGYLVFDTKWVADIIEDFVEQGYPTIGKFEPLSYLFFTNIRKGCPFGIQGSKPGFFFHVR